MKKKYHLAEINVARMKGVNIDDPIMQEFVDNLGVINELAEASDGFVWRLKDDNDNATSLNPYNDEQVIINVSVWESIETLQQYVFKSFHSEFLKRRKEWFYKYGKVHTAMWWVEAGQVPTLQEAVDKLAYLQEQGASVEAFTFKDRFPCPK